ncbi:hypothetical protein KSS87_005158 [Heliosperma pusillum]|nr:hypothetical protein KSS87_005158 [Heliosperma pusillum]
MSQEYHHHHHHHQQQNANNIYSFPNGYDRSTEDPSTTTEDPTGTGLNPAVYESAGMLSEMFNFGHGPGPGPNPTPAGPSELLDYRRDGGVGGIGNDEWYGTRPIAHHEHTHNIIGDHSEQHHHDLSGGINAHNSAAAIQLFLTNPSRRSPSPPPPQQQPPPPPNIHGSGVGGAGFHSIVGTQNNPNNFWGAVQIDSSNNNNPGELSGMIEGQGLSLSLSSSLQHLEAVKHAEHNHIMFFNHQHQQGIGPSSSVTTNTSSSPTHFFKNLTNNPGPQAHTRIILPDMHAAGGYVGPGTSGVGFGSASLGAVNVLRNSRYAKPAQELLEEFCSVGRGQQLKKPKLGRQNSSNRPNSGSGGGGGSGAAGSSSSSKDPPQLSSSDRIEHQRRKVKLVAMLDEVDGRYNHYCEQMQMVVNSFDLVMGYGGAVPYTALAQKAMSRHFRCLKDAIHAQLKHSCELLGEKDPTGSSGLTKGETPRLKVLEQSLRQQRAFHQMGMMDQEAWRPQRGLPERSVNILRAWLFEHFLNPYPSDADKHLLARQTGLSRNQVSNWFINARVRLWKPMVEDMYQQEAKDEDDDDHIDQDDDQTTSSNTNIPTTQQPQQQQEQQQLQQQQQQQPQDSTTLESQQPDFLQGVDVSSQFDEEADPTTMIRFGNTTGDVSLTLGLRHAGNAAPEKSDHFSVRDFGS